MKDRMAEEEPDLRSLDWETEARRLEVLAAHLERNGFLQEAAHMRADADEYFMRAAS